MSSGVDIDMTKANLSCIVVDTRHRTKDWVTVKVEASGTWNDLLKSFWRARKDDEASQKQPCELEVFRDDGSVRRLQRRQFGGKISALIGNGNGVPLRVDVVRPEDVLMRDPREVDAAVKAAREQEREAAKFYFKEQLERVEAKRTDDAERLKQKEMELATLKNEHEQNGRLRVKKRARPEGGSTPADDAGSDAAEDEATQRKRKKSEPKKNHGFSRAVLANHAAYWKTRKDKTVVEDPLEYDKRQPGKPFVPIRVQNRPVEVQQPDGTKREDPQLFGVYYTQQQNGKLTLPARKSDEWKAREFKVERERVFGTLNVAPKSVTEMSKLEAHIRQVAQSESLVQAVVESSGDALFRSASLSN